MSLGIKFGRQCGKSTTRFNKVVEFLELNYFFNHYYRDKPHNFNHIALKVMGPTNYIRGRTPGKTTTEGMFYGSKRDVKVWPGMGQKSNGKFDGLYDAFRSREARGTVI